MESSQEYFDFFGTQKIESLHKKQRKPNLYFGSVISSPFHFYFHAFAGKKRRRGLRHANPKQGRSGAAAPTPNNAKGKRVFQFATPFVFPSPPGFLFLSYFAESPQKTKEPPYALGFPKMKTRKGTFFSWELYSFSILSFTTQYLTFPEGTEGFPRPFL